MNSGSTGLAARRREDRSSGCFQFGLASCLLFCILVPWCSHHLFLPAKSQLQQSVAAAAAAAVLSPLSPLPPAHHDGPAGHRQVTSQGDRSDSNNNNNIIIMGETRNKHYSGQAGGSNEPVVQEDSSLHLELRGGQSAQLPLRLVSFNIRYATQEDERALGEQPWHVRCPKICTQLRFLSAGHESPFICLQEALLPQVRNIQARLGAPWANIGRGRGQGETDGEFSPIFYREDAWACEHSETRWLSETPEKPSRGWDAALNRIVTIGLFSHRETGTKVVVMSTHFDHMGVQARKNSAALLIEFAEEWSHVKGQSPSAVLIAGDFNSQPDDEAYKVMTAPASGMSDLSDLVPESRHYGNHLTYTSFGEPSEYPQRIDFLFIREPRTALVETFGVLANSFDDQIRFSDHRPVVSDLKLRV